MKYSKILGIGTALPPNSINQADAAKLAEIFLAEEQSSIVPLLPKLYSKAGVGTRYSVLFSGSGNLEQKQTFYSKSLSADDLGPSLSKRMKIYSEAAPLLVAQASRYALEEADCEPKQITHLVTVSCTGFAAPGVDIALINSLGLSAGVQRTNVGFMGCHGAINGMRCASALAVANPEAVILLCAVELCTLHCHNGDNPEQIVANSLFGDGAAAAVISADSTSGSATISDFASNLFPDTKEDMSWIMGDNSFQMSLSARVPDLIRKGLRPWLSNWLAKHDLTIEEIEHWAVHPGGPRILRAVEQCLDLKPEALKVSRETLANIGNISSPTVLFITKQLLKSKVEKPLVMLGFGPGLVSEAALIIPPLARLLIKS